MPVAVGPTTASTRVDGSGTDPASRRSSRRRTARRRSSSSAVPVGRRERACATAVPRRRPGRQQLGAAVRRRGPAGRWRRLRRGRRRRRASNALGAVVEVARGLLACGGRCRRRATTSATSRASTNAVNVRRAADRAQSGPAVKPATPARAAPTASRSEPGADGQRRRQTPTAAAGATELRGDVQPTPQRPRASPGGGRGRRRGRSRARRAGRGPADRRRMAVAAGGPDADRARRPARDRASGTRARGLRAEGDARDHATRLVTPAGSRDDRRPCGSRPVVPARPGRIVSNARHEFGVGTHRRRRHRLRPDRRRRTGHRVVAGRRPRGRAWPSTAAASTTSPPR